MVFGVMLHAAYQQHGAEAWGELSPSALAKLGLTGLRKQKRIIEAIFEYRLPDKFWEAGEEAIVSATRHQRNQETFFKETGDPNLSVGKVYMVREDEKTIRSYVYTNQDGEPEGWLPGWALL